MNAAPFGGAAIDLTGDPLPQATLDEYLAADAVLLGAIGVPKWGPLRQYGPNRADADPLASWASTPICGSIKLHTALRDSSAIKPEVLDGVDLVFVREPTGGIYFGEKTRTATHASTCVPTRSPKSSASRASPAGSRTRRKKVCSIDKSNVLGTLAPWREVAERVIKTEFPA